jgi:hypothetical protein
MTIFREKFLKETMVQKEENSSVLAPSSKRSFSRVGADL